MILLRVVLLAALLPFLVSRSLADSASAEALIGLWSASLDDGPAVRGELTIERDGDGLRASVAGRQARFQARGDSIEFTLPDGGGGFRGRVATNGVVEGFWLQGAGTIVDGADPGGSWQRFATPMTLLRAGQGRWRGTVVPLDRRFTLYLQVRPWDGGNPVGAFRNPEFNSIGRATLYRVFREGDSLFFCLRADSTAPYEKYVRASIEKDPERIRVDWSDMGRTLELRRRTPREAAAFFPRPPGDTNYVYQRPPETGDGWRTARGRDTGMSEDTLARLVNRLVRLDPAARRPALIHSLLIAHRGRLVLEEYFFGHDRETRHDLRSAGKTFGSVMLGVAMANGVPIGPDSRIYELLAARGPFANPDPRKERITLAHLMTHTPGLDTNDNDDASRGNEGTLQSQVAQPDWWKYTLDLPMKHDPGTRYAYGSANSNLVGAALTTATGTWLPAYFERTIARPLEFGPWSWNLMPTNEGYLGGGAFLRPRDLLKVGQVFLDGGRWKGRRIVDSSWVRISTAPRIHISPETTGIPPEEFGEYYGEGDDAYAWHLGKLNVKGRPIDTYAATGNGGQILMVVPAFDLVVVFTAGNYRQGGIWTRFGGEIVPDEIIPAIQR